MTRQTTPPQHIPGCLAARSGASIKEDKRPQNVQCGGSHHNYSSNCLAVATSAFLMYILRGARAALREQ